MTVMELSDIDGRAKMGIQAFRHLMGIEIAPDQASVFYAERHVLFRVAGPKSGQRVEASAARPVLRSPRKLTLPDGQRNRPRVFPYFSCAKSPSIRFVIK